MNISREILYLLSGIIVTLSLSTIIAWILKKKAISEQQLFTAQNLFDRVISWWYMVLFFGLAMICGKIVSIILFSLISFFALREFIAIVPTRKADHHTLFWLFFVIVPLQYILLYVNWYGMFAIFIPVYAFLFVPVRLVVVGDCENFFERTAKIQWTLMACVYCVSYAPAILNLRIPGFEKEGAKLLLFFTIIVQICDVMQYVWGKLFGKQKIIASVSPNKTWAGFIGGVISAGIIGVCLSWITPFNWWQAFMISVAIGCFGFVGDITMSAIKRDVQIKDYSQLIKGHGGMMDRIDSLCFAAPVFYHIVRYYFM